jgi:hypothetical protein
MEHLSSTGTFVSLLIILHISACISEQIISAVMTTNCLPHEWSELIWPNADGVMSILMVILESLITYQTPPAMSVLPALVQTVQGPTWQLRQAERAPRRRQWRDKEEERGVDSAPREEDYSDTCNIQSN